MKKTIILTIFVSIFLLVSFNNSALAETTCDIDAEDCKITITIKIAFSGATNQQIQSWKNEIEDVWNGPNNYQTTGDCKCLVEFKVETMKITNPANVNCNPPPAGYHCVMVTPWNNNNNNLPWFYKPDGTKKYVTAYMGYSTQSPSQGGASIDGWWSDQTSRPVPDAQGNPTGENYKDAAHEAGHMMGLGDEEGAPNIMGQTSGPNAKPTQEQIDKVVENVCGQNACPDSCCCGDGKIDEDKGEECDPMAEDSKCGEGQYCCPICCQCHSQLCDPEDSEYATQSDCQKRCEDGQCLYNYQTGCWDCKKYEPRITTILTTTNLKWLGFGILLSTLFVVSIVLKKVKLFLIGLGILAVVSISYFLPDMSKIFEKPFEGFPSPEPSLEYAGEKEIITVFSEIEETQGEVPEEAEGEKTPPVDEETEQLQDEGLPAEEPEEVFESQEEKPGIPLSYHIENPPYYREDGFCWGASAIILMMNEGFSEEEIQAFRTILKSGPGGPPDMFRGFREFGVIDRTRIAYSKNYNKQFADFYNQQILTKPEEQVILLNNQADALNKLKKLISSDILVMIVGHHGNHYMVVTGYDENYIYISDPGIDKVFLEKIDYQSEYQEKTKMLTNNFFEQWNISDFEGGGIGFPGDYGMIWLVK